VRFPPALAASATPRILDALGDPPGRVLELGFAGIHAVPLELAGFDVVVVERDERERRRAEQRARLVLPVLPEDEFDAVVAPADADLRAVRARRAILVGRDGSVNVRAD
jgi:hypothetical protein